jgi:membrane-associated protein
MDFLLNVLHYLLDLLSHPDKVLKEFVDSYNNWAYGFLFLIIFVETGLVIMPFLPGDSLLFLVGAFS